MDKHFKNEELQSRREFFKKAAKAALPVVSAVVLPQLLNAQTGGRVYYSSVNVLTGECSGCSGTCSGGCQGSCMGSCVSTCAANGANSTYNPYSSPSGCGYGTGCMNSCSGGCTGTCYRSCNTGCDGYNYY